MIKIIQENPDYLPADKFKELVTHDPDWVLTVTRPTEIVGTVVLIGSNIRHLSPLLSFRPTELGQGTNGGWNPDPRLIEPENMGMAADFRHCNRLKVAAGTFHGSINFWNAAIEEIDPGLTVTRPNGQYNGADFRACSNLKTARGSYAGLAMFGPNIEVVENINIDNMLVRNRLYLSFQDCPNLKSIPEELLRNTKVKMDETIRKRLLGEIAGRRAMKQPDLML